VGDPLLGIGLGGNGELLVVMEPMVPVAEYATGMIYIFGSGDAARPALPRRRQAGEYRALRTTSLSLVIWAKKGRILTLEYSGKCGSNASRGILWLRTGLGTGAPRHSLPCYVSPFG
jgi:hypothetical protein